MANSHDIVLNPGSAFSIDFGEGTQYILIMHTSTNLQTSDNIGLTQHHILAVNDSIQAHTSGNTVITHHVVTFSMITNAAIMLEYLPVSQVQLTNAAIMIEWQFHYVLTVSDAIQSQTIFETNIRLNNYPAIAENATQVQQSDNTILTEHQYIRQTSAAIMVEYDEGNFVRQTSSAIMVEYSYDILLTSLANPTQSQTADNVAFTQHHILEIPPYNFFMLEDDDSFLLENGDSFLLEESIGGATQIQTSDNAEVIRRYVLSLTYCSWFLLEDGSYFTLEDGWRALGEDAVPGTCQSQTSENVELTQHYVLSLLDYTSLSFQDDYYGVLEDGVTLILLEEPPTALQAQTSDNVILEVPTGALEVQDSIQLQTSDNIILTPITTITVSDAIQLQNSDNIVLTQNYVLIIEGATQSQTSENVILTAFYTITTDNAVHLQSSDNILLIQHHILLIDNVIQLQTSDNVILIQNYLLSINDTEHAHTSDNIDLIQNYALSIQDSTQLQTSNNTVLSAHYSIITENTIQLQTSENVELTAHYSINVNDAIQVQTSDNIILTQHHILSVQNSEQIQTSDSIELIFYGVGILTIQNAIQLQSCESVGLTQHHILSVQDALQFQIVDNIILSQNYFITVENAIHLQSSESIGLNAHYSIITNNTTELQNSDNIELVQNYIISIQDSTQLQTSDNIELTAHYSIIINNASHYFISCEVSETASDYILTEQYFGTDGVPGLYFPLEASGNITIIYHEPHFELIVQDSSHNQTSDNIILSAHYSLTAEDATQLQTVENVILTQRFSLTVEDAVHLQSSENVALLQHYILTIQDAIHLQTSDNIVLIQHQVLIVNDTVQIQTSENIILTQHNMLGIDSTVQLQTADNIILTQHYILSVDDAIQLQTSDGLIFGGMVENSIQPQTSDNIELTQHHILVVSDSIQIQISDNVGFMLFVYGASQLQISDNTTLIQNYVLTIQNTIQLQTSENTILTQHYGLTIQNATQLQVIGWNWWVVSGVSCTAAYQPKGAFNYTDSKTNIANPGTYNATDGTAYPTWTTGSGWQFTQASSQYLTSLCPANLKPLTYVVRLAPTGTGYRSMLGASANGGAQFRVDATTNKLGFLKAVVIGILGGNAAFPSSGVAAVTYSSTGFCVLYINGVIDNSGTNNQTFTSSTLRIGDDTPSNHEYYNGTIQAISIYNSALTEYQIKKLSSGINSLDSIVLSAYSPLQVNDSTQAQTANNTELASRFAVLTVQDAIHVQTSENTIITTDIYISVAKDSIQLQTSDNIRLETNIYILVVHDSSQLQASDKIGLLAHYTLVMVNNTSQTQTSQNVSIFKYIIGKVYSKVGSFNIDPTKTAGQTQIITEVGFTPKLVLFWCSGGTSTGSYVSGGTFNIVFGAATDGANRFSIGSISEDAQGTSDNAHWTYNTQIIRIYNDTGSLNGILDFTSMNSDGFTVHIDDQFTAAFKVNYMALAGTDFTPKIGYSTFRSSTGNQSYTGVGFKPEALIFATAFSTGVAAAAAHIYFTLGMTSGSTKQGTTAIKATDNIGITDSISYGYNGESMAYPAGIGNCSYRSSLVSFDTDGFTLSMTDPGSSLYFYYIALKGAQFNVGDINTRTDKNDITETIGFTPSALLMFSTNRVLDTVDVATANVAISIGASDYKENQAVAGVWEEYNMDVSEDAHANNTSNIYVNVAHDAIRGLMGIKSFNIDGFTAAMDIVDPTENWVTYLAIGEPPTFLIVQDATQAHVAESPLLVFLENPMEPIYDSIQLQTSENVELTQHHILEMQDAVQLQVPDYLRVTTDIYILRTDDSTQTQTSTNVYFSTRHIYAHRKISFGIGKNGPGL